MTFKCKKCKKLYNTNYYYASTYGDNGICLNCLRRERSQAVGINLHSKKTYNLSGINEGSRLWIVEIQDNQKIFKFRVCADSDFEVRYKIWDLISEKFPEINLLEARIKEITQYA